MKHNTIIIEAESGKEDRSAPVSTSEANRIASSKSRISIPLNLNNWKNLPEDLVNELIWFHQHALEHNMSLEDCAKAINYSGTTVYRVLKGAYQGDYESVIANIRSYKSIISERTAIQNADFCETRITKLVAGGLSYALANNSMTLIIGESRMGKTASAKHWRDQNNHGRTVFVTAPAYGGAKALLIEIASCLGISRNHSATNIHVSILRAFNENRMLIVDEAHRLLPSDQRTNPVLLELLRDIHDRTRCGLGLLATERFQNAMAKSSYQFEQVLGRIGMPVRLPREFVWTDVSPIVSQYLKKVPTDLQQELLKIANSPGRLGIVCETLKFASRIAGKKKITLDADVVKTAIATRHQMMGETQYAKK